MTNQEVREILMRYRPGQMDPDDDRVQEALELAARDPDLAAWFEQHCAMQKAIRACFQQIEVPEGLKEQILSERKAHFAKATRRRAAITVASILVIAAAIFVIIRPNFSGPGSDDTFASFRARMAGDVQRLYPAMDLETNRLDVIRDYLAQNQGHAQVAVPPALYGVAPTGCAILNWHGKRVSMICFNSGKNSSASSPDLFLFVIQKSQIEAPPGAGAAEFNQIKGMATASWSSGDKVYLLGGIGDEAFLKKFL
jgi:hypothetical protein